MALTDAAFSPSFAWRNLASGEAPNYSDDRSDDYNCHDDQHSSRSVMAAASDIEVLAQFGDHAQPSSVSILSCRYLPFTMDLICSISEPIQQPGELFSESGGKPVVFGAPRS
jgi:hypothetical protein